MLRVHTWQEPRWAKREALLQPAIADLFSERGSPEEAAPLSQASIAVEPVSIQEMIRRAKAQLNERPA
jgi:hypothetical protein